MIKQSLNSFPFAQIYIILFDNKIKYYILVTFLVDMIEISLSFSFGEACSNLFFFFSFFLF